MGCNKRENPFPGQEATREGGRKVKMEAGSKRARAKLAAQVVTRAGPAIDRKQLESAPFADRKQP
jgi:hypothetical protein